MNSELVQLLALRKRKLQIWAKGRVPHHYKRISVDPEEAVMLAKQGEKAVWDGFHTKLYFTQALIAGGMLSKKYKDFCFCTSSQYGKALADDTPVLTKGGWKRHGDLRVGDYVLGLDGRFVKVLAVHPKCEMDRVVTLQNGDKFICHHNHEWVYKSRGKIRTVSVAEMEERGLKHGNANKFIIPGKCNTRGVGIANIEKTSGVQGNCITVEGGIYLVGKHLIPTHNSFTFAMVAILLADRGHNVFVAGARKDTADIIMGHVYEALQRANSTIRRKLVGDSKDQIERLNKSLSKAKISFANGGCIQPITFGDTYGGLAMNSAIGRGGDYIVDEAALVSDDALAEIGRADFAKIGHRMITAMISNPHNPGTFYTKLAEEEAPADRLVVWADCLTAIEEERFDEETVLKSTFAHHKTTLRRYLLCELDVNGESMFDTPKVVPEIKTDESAYHFLGVDAAYKGKDNICVALVSVTTDGRVHAEEIAKIEKHNWIDGVTNVEIVNQITRVARAVNCSLVCVDQGYGVWLINGLLEKGINALGVAFQGKPTKARVQARQYAATNAYNKRAEMHLDLQNLIDDQVFDITEEAYEQVKDIFPFVRADRKENGTIKVRGKDKIKEQIGRSPDELDSLILAIHASIIFFGETLNFIE